MAEKTVRDFIPELENLISDELFERIEEYAKLKHSELSKPTEDVEKLIVDESEFRYQHFNNPATKQHFTLGFQDGARFGCSLNDNKWISVEDRLPWEVDDNRIGQEFNVRLKNGFITSLFYLCGNWKRYTKKGFEPQDKGNPVTHYKPLPTFQTK